MRCARVVTPRCDVPPWGGRYSPPCARSHRVRCTESLAALYALGYVSVARLVDAVRYLVERRGVVALDLRFDARYELYVPRWLLHVSDALMACPVVDEDRVLALLDRCVEDHDLRGVVTSAYALGGRAAVVALAPHRRRP